MAASSTASDRAGSALAQGAAGEDGRAHAGSWNEACSTASSVSRGPGQVGHDRAVAKDVDVVAVLQLVGLGRVPDERAARLGLGADDGVDLALGADVDAAHRVVHEHDLGGGAQRAGEQRLLLVAAGQRQDVVVHVGRPDADPLPPAARELGLAHRRRPAQPRQLAQRADGDVPGDRPEREDAVGLPVAGHQRGAAVDLDALAPRAGGIEDAQQHLALALAAPARRAPRSRPDRPPAPGRRLRPGCAAGHGCSRVAIARRRRSLRRLGDVAHGGHERVARELAGRSRRDDQAVAHHHDPVGGGQDLAQEMRDQDAGAAAGHEAAHEGEQLVGHDRVQGRGRLVEDHQPAGHVGDGEGARDLDQLALPDGEVADQIAGGDAVAREDRVEPVARSAARRAAASPGRVSAGCTTRAFSATVRFGQSDSSWNTQRTPWRCAATTP